MVWIVGHRSEPVASFIETPAHLLDAPRDRDYSRAGRFDMINGAIAWRHWCAADLNSNSEGPNQEESLRHTVTGALIRRRAVSFRQAHRVCLSEFISVLPR
jgi:hypothetical protein